MLFGMQAKYGLIQKRGDWQCSIRHAYLQLSIYLLLQFELHDYFCTILLTYIYFSVWIGSTNLAVSQLSAPFLVALCRRKSAFAILAKVIPEGWAVIVTAQPSGTTLILATF